MLIFPQPSNYPMQHPSGSVSNSRGESQINIDAIHVLTKLGPAQSFTSPEGTYEGKECLSIPTPMPHPSDPAPTIVNPLAPTRFLPTTFSSGVRLSITTLRQAPPPGTVEYQQKLLRSHKSVQPLQSAQTRKAYSVSNSSHLLLPRTTSNASKLSKPVGKSTSWTSTLFNANNSARRSPATVAEEYISGPPNADAISSLDRYAPGNSEEQNGGSLVNSKVANTPNSNGLASSIISINQNLKAGSALTTSIRGDTKESLRSNPINSEGRNMVKLGSSTFPLISSSDTLPLPPDSIGGVLGPLTVLIPTEPVKDLKRKKPKSSLVKNNSSFISKTVSHDSLSKKLNEHAPDELFVWANMGRTFTWFDWTPSPVPDTKKEFLTKILFTKSHPLCHDVNQFTRSVNCIDLVLGMSSGDAVWLDACSNKYLRINKNGDIDRSAVTDIKWIPGSPNYFVTLHANGTLKIFDKDREDGGFAAAGGLNHQDPRSTDTFRIIKSLYGSSGTGSNSTGFSSNTSNFNSNKHNPVAMYKLSHRSLTSVTFSPDRQTLVITSNDGFMRFLNLATEVVTDVIPSYYDGILCSAFSPDGKYLATGGRDDLVTIWSMRRKTIIARGYGHQSWVRKVAFDNWNCDELSYRVGSVGEDGNLIFWDFSPKPLSRPKAASQNTDSYLASIANISGTARKGHFRELSSARSFASGVSGASEFGRQQEKFEDASESLLAPQKSLATVSIRSVSGATPMDHNSYMTILHPFIGREGVPTIPPVVIKTVKTEAGEPESLSDIAFLSNQIMVVGKDGRLWTWARPNA